MPDKREKSDGFEPLTGKIDKSSTATTAPESKKNTHQVGWFRERILQNIFVLGPLLFHKGDMKSRFNMTWKQAAMVYVMASGVISRPIMGEKIEHYDDYETFKKMGMMAGVMTMSNIGSEFIYKDVVTPTLSKMSSLFCRSSEGAKGTEKKPLLEDYEKFEIKEASEEDKKRTESDSEEESDSKGIELV